MFLLISRLVPNICPSVPSRFGTSPWLAGSIQNTVKQQSDIHSANYCVWTTRLILLSKYLEFSTGGTMCVNPTKSQPFVATFEQASAEK